MSGTSLDGLDIAYVEFIKKKKWHYLLGPCQTIKYTEEWVEKLHSLSEKSTSYISKVDRDFGAFIATCVNDFIKANQVNVDLICSHGHTVFHQPEINYTLQIGSGKTIAQKSKKMVVCDFRSLDVSLNGQGAPLVPLGDMLLFANYTYCLNLGGFSNVSYQKKTERKAFDICPVNIVLNKLAQKLGHPFDKNGEIAKNGSLNNALLNQLNQLNYYQLKGPKSLGKEWVEEFIDPLLRSDNSIQNLLHTFTEHAAYQIGKKLRNGSCLVTGGGAYNKHLINRIQQYTNCELNLPDNQTIEYKEALIFGLLGVLKYRNEVNCLRSVTGAVKDSCSGLLFTPD